MLVRRPRTTILVAAGLLWLVSSFVPFGGLILYPFTLFTTWVHEMGHGLTALLVGGGFDRLEIFSDASGLAHTASYPGWRMAAVSAGGLLAPPILGALVLALVHGPRRARVFLAATALLLLVSMLIWVRSATGLVAMPILAALLGWSAWRGFQAKPQRRVLLAQALGVLLAVDTATRMVKYVFTPKVTIDGETRASDIAAIAENLGGHYLLWGVAITAIALGLLALGLWRAWRVPAAAEKK